MLMPINGGELEVEEATPSECGCGGCSCKPE